MPQTRRDLIDAVFHNQKADRVPVGFWHHFLPHPHTDDAWKHPSLTDDALAAQADFYEAFPPDLLKVMTDGFFGYPHPAIRKAMDSAADIGDFAPLGKHSRWYEDQIAFARKLSFRYGRDVPLFYNLFTPYRALGFAQEAAGHPFDFVDWIRRDKAAVQRVLAVLAADYAALAEGLLTEGGMDGIYFSVNNVDRNRLSEAEYREVVRPGEIEVLEAANRVRDNQILHICGYRGFRNHLSWYTEYPVRAVNWATHVEGVPLSEGKTLFGGKAVIGGFGQTADDLLYAGSEEEIRKETARLLQDAGHTGVILGADCTIPPDTDVRRLEWVREEAARLSRGQ